MCFLVVSILNDNNMDISCLPNVYVFIYVVVLRYTVFKIFEAYICFFNYILYVHHLHLLYVRRNLNNFTLFLLQILMIFDFSLYILKLSIYHYQTGDAYVFAQTYSILLLRLYTCDYG